MLYFYCSVNHCQKKGFDRCRTHRINSEYNGVEEEAANSANDCDANGRNQQTKPLCEFGNLLKELFHNTFSFHKYIRRILPSDMIISQKPLFVKGFWKVFLKFYCLSFGMSAGASTSTGVGGTSTGTAGADSTGGSIDSVTTMSPSSFILRPPKNPSAVK